MLLTVGQFRQYMADEVALSDDALRVMLDANEDLLIEWAGPPGRISETIYSGGSSLLALSQRPQSIESVSDITGSTTLELDDTDYLVSGRYLRRVQHRRWGERTTVTYISAASAARYITALVKLMKADLNDEPGMSSQSAGPWQESYRDIAAEKQRILEEVRPRELFA